MSDDLSLAVHDLRRQRAVIADFGLFAFGAEDIDEVLDRATELVSQALGVELVKVLEHQPERGAMLMRSGVGWQPGVVGRETFDDGAHSPGGYALITDEPVVSPDIRLETRFSIPDVLIRHRVLSMVNVVIAGDSEPFGVLEVDARQPRDFNEDEVAFLRNYANLLAAAIDRIRSHQQLSESAQEQRLLARELGHRVKNVLGLVQALAAQTTTRDTSAEQYRDAFVGRLQALAKSETLVFDAGTDAVDLMQLSEAVLEPFRVGRTEAVEVQGSRLLLPARKGRMLGLALHELATNAAKYGALSKPDGRVALRWRLEEAAAPPRVHLTWEERDGVEVVPPLRKGFGTRLLESLVSGELDGTAELTYDPTGLRYRLRFPADMEQRDVRRG